MLACRCFSTDVTSMLLLMLLFLLLPGPQAFRIQRNAMHRRERKAQVSMMTRNNALPFSLLVFSSPLLAAHAALIPVDISSTDLMSSRYAEIQQQSVLIPDTSIQTLDGGWNLGFLLFTYVLYNGIFGKIGRPADWLLPSLSKVTQQEETEWYKNFQEGYSYDVPPLVEALRVAVFAILGFGLETAWVASFGGDTFWAWSTGICLALPSSLITLARDPLPTREENMATMALKEAFEEFASQRLTRVRGDKKVYANQVNIIVAFRRSFGAYRTEEDVSDRTLQKLIRKWVGYKADSSGQYFGLSLTNKKEEARVALEKSILRAKALGDADAKENLQDDNGNGDGDDEDEVPMIVAPKDSIYDNEFVRK